MLHDEFRRLQGPSGLDIELLSTGQFKTVLMALVVEAPLDEERCARALLPDLLSRGTASWPDLDSLSARCEELYDTEIVAQASALGGRQLLRLGVETLADRWTDGVDLLDQAAALLGEVVHAPPLENGRFRADHFEQERRNLEHAVRGLADDKAGWAEWRLMQQMHAGTPFAHHAWGELDQVRALDESAVRSAWGQVRERLPARLFLVGDVDEDGALRVAERLGAGADRAPPTSPWVPVEVGAREPSRCVEHQDLNQAKLAMGFRLPVSRLAGAGPGLMGEILGGSATSRLFKRVREEESLAYGCGAVCLPESGTLLVQAGIPPGSAARVEELVQEELGRLAAERVPEEEFEQARAGLRRRLRASLDRPLARLGFRMRGLLTGRATRIEAALDELERVQPEEVLALAAGCRLDSVFLLENGES